MLLDGGNPKVPPAELRKIIHDAGMQVTEGKADFGVVVGGDGRFGWYGRTEDIPLLFVGVKSKSPTGSKAYLAQTTLDELPEALMRVKAGDYSINQHRRLGVLKNGESVGEVFTDVYLQRGSESTCLRYNVRVGGQGVKINEFAIGDGVVVTTQAGSSGYYSYPDRIKGEWMDPLAFAEFGRDEVGICHVTPTYTEREGTRQHPLRYVVPWGSRVEVFLFRKADARLYGTTDSSAGIQVKIGDTISIGPGRKMTRVISL
jgi:hypothetical protein